jgi:hypothetical protein
VMVITTTLDQGSCAAARALCAPDVAFQTSRSIA